MILEVAINYVGIRFFVDAFVYSFDVDVLADFTEFLLPISELD